MSALPPLDDVIDSGLLETVSARLDLRQPNRDALELIAYRLHEHYVTDDREGVFEGVADVATGVGKTYIIAAAIEYFSTLGTRNFAVIAPGRTIQRKTEAQFTAGTAKSLLGAMDVEPVVITSENFSSAEIATALDDPEQVKLFVFTVQALLKPDSKVGRRTHKFQEGLGKAFYEHLVSLDDLFVFADEHHCYYGDAFSKAVRGLQPHALIGLTATPHKKTPAEEIIYRYPLSAAIAEELVKSPVIVGRTDDRIDFETKLLDATRLLALKERAIEANRDLLGGKTVNPVMLVVAKSIEDAEEVARILRDPSFADGRYASDDPAADPVLVVHSNAPDEALALLDAVEEPASPVRAIVSVGMLKEGWDVKSVYVIVSLRSSVSEILTEQTLGRGLRLPFGAYTGIEILDTLEVVAHERYAELLKRHDKINEAFIDLRTHLEVRRNAEGQSVLVATTSEVVAPVETDDGGLPGVVGLVSFDARTERAEANAVAQVELRPRDDLPVLVLPKTTTERVAAEFSLADIAFGEYANPFRELGERLAVNPSEELRRTRLGATIVEGPDGIRRTVTTTSGVADKVSSEGKQLSLDGARGELVDRICASRVVAPRKAERVAADAIVDTFLAGVRSRAGDEAERVVSAYLDRAAQRLIELITTEQRRLAKTPKVSQRIEPAVFAPLRIGRPETSADLRGEFKRALGYIGWQRSLYEQSWFDSSTERSVAVLLDSSDEIAYWVRLLRKDLEIAWEGGNYNPDLVAIDTESTHWLIEVKSDKDAASEDVAAKRAAALRWANHVSAAPKLNGVKWRYLLAREADIEQAKDSWPALRGLGIA